MPLVPAASRRIRSDYGCAQFRGDIPAFAFGETHRLIRAFGGRKRTLMMVDQYPVRRYGWPLWRCWPFPVEASDAAPRPKPVNVPSVRLSSNAGLIGVNLEGVGDGARARYFVDLAKTLRPWGGLDGKPMPLDGHGWPTCGRHLQFSSISARSRPGRRPSTTPRRSSRIGAARTKSRFMERLLLRDRTPPNAPSPTNCMTVPRTRRHWI